MELVANYVFEDDGYYLCYQSEGRNIYIYRVVSNRGKQTLASFEMRCRFYKMFVKSGDRFLSSNEFFKADQYTFNKKDLTIFKLTEAEALLFLSEDI